MSLSKHEFAVVAQPLPGVLAVITGHDLPRVKFGILPVSQDEEALCTEKVRMVGDALAAVAAVDEETADAACRLIEVDYEPLPALMSIQESLAHPEIRIHEYGDGPNVHKNVALQFGDVDAALAACRLSQLCGRPVKITCTREEVFYIHRGRHPVLMWIRTGFTKDGDITGCHLRTWLDGGAYGSYGVASTFYTGVINPVTYKMPVYRFEGARIFTNKPPCGPKRGHGTPQPRFALECQLDKAAEQLGLDPADMRRRIVAEPFTKTANHLTITTIGLGECLDKVVEASGWRHKRARFMAAAKVADA